MIYSPYSPNLNPIDGTFGIIKNDINTKIINDFINNNFFNNYKQINKDCSIAIKNNNKKIKIEEKKIEVANIANYKKITLKNIILKLMKILKKCTLI